MCSYGHEGYQIISRTLTYMFPDRSFDLTPWKPLSWYGVVHDVLLPETVVQLIQDDMPRLDRTRAISTSRNSLHYGNILHYNEDSLVVREVARKIADCMGRNTALYDEYEKSGSSLNFNDWVQEGKRAAMEVVKQEDIELGIGTWHQGEVHSDVIDLTLDD